MPRHSITLESPWNRIRLVPPSAEDDEAFAGCRTHPISRRYLRFLPTTMTTEEARLFREKRAEESDRVDFYIQYTKEDGTTSFGGNGGYFHIDSANLACESGIIVHPDLHGKNIATELFYVLLRHIFEDKKLHRVMFITASDNVGMLGWLEKVAGATLEGEMREAWKGLDGKFASAKAYSILEGEWWDGVKRLEDRMNRALSK
ncbi:acyl-CoA N-acyltransferase [Crepidotus variabilis]|uniref:Acyl-CoA N-acyltransferase n=1 Tax=Crepidotus variabilis TaxID=179855 RepID=A0A9P6EIF6_9AGAR|nr:acyl-CoA N-acyltransferase [Crepidotus variabilis]